MMNSQIKQYSELIIGSILLSLGIYLFVTPCRINFGGVIGISQIINHFIPGNHTGIINLLINIPLFILAFRIMNIDFCIKTILSLMIQTLILSALPPLNAPLVDDILLNCIFGAMLCGAGVGYALRGSGSCGGIDILCMCLLKKNHQIKTGIISIWINFFLLIICLLIYDLKITMYSIVFLAVLYTISDKFHDQNINIAAIIFTDNKQMKEHIMSETKRGVTVWEGYGAYTGNEKDILFCAINKYEINELRKIIFQADPAAFITFFEGPMIEGGFEKRL